MQLTCPGCGARYRIDARNWPSDPAEDGAICYRARRARCKVCGTLWTATPEEEVLELDDPLPPFDEPRPADVAWAALSGWPEQKPLPAPKPDFAPPLDQPPPVFTPSGFTPPRDQSEAIYQAPRRPAITFEAPPVPISPQPLNVRLPGPRAIASTIAAPEPQPEIPEDPEMGWEGEEDEWADDEAPRRRWPIVALILLLLAGAALYLLATGRIRPEEYGLRPFDPSAIGLPSLHMPNVSMPHVSLPRAQPSPLKLEASAARSQLGDGRPLWEISGTIQNPTKSRQTVPPIEVRMVDQAGKTVSRWTIRAEIRNLAPDGTARFATSAIDPPPEAVRVRLLLKPSELGRL